jgi:hypothetical protein
LVRFRRLTLRSATGPEQRASPTRFRVGTSRCEVPARGAAGGTNAQERAGNCAAGRGADGAARHPHQGQRQDASVAAAQPVFGREIRQEPPIAFQVVFHPLDPLNNLLRLLRLERVQIFDRFGLELDLAIHAPHRGADGQTFLSPGAIGGGVAGFTFTSR